MHLDVHLSSIPFRNRWTLLHPAEKVMFSAGLLALTFSSPWGGILSFAAGTLAALYGAHVPAISWLRFVSAPMGFTVLGCLPLCIDWNGSTHLDPRVAGILTRAIGSASAAGFIGLTTPMDQVFYVLSRAGFPSAFIGLLHASYRFLFTMFASLGRMLEATSQRSVLPGWRRYLNTLSLLTTSLLVRSLRQAARKEAALDWRLGGESIAMLQSWRDVRPWIVIAQALVFLCLAAMLWRLR